jgi:hypothetical protein
MSTLPAAGHAPGHLRDAFCEAIAGRDDDELHRLSGLLWTCTDTLPSAFCGSLDLPDGSTYAQAARAVRR